MVRPVLETLFKILVTLTGSKIFCVLLLQLHEVRYQTVCLS